MKKLFLLSITFLSVILLPSVAQADTKEHRFATYNIRYSLSGNGDTGNKLWANRAQYVYRIIRDYDFDVVGMQEVTGGTSTQLSDVQKNMSEYTMYAIESAPGDQGFNAILFKTARYDLIEQGHFFLNEHPATPGKGWTSDENHPRLCIWNHLKDKESGKDIYFCCTHVNYGATESGIESSRLMARTLRDLAGQTPVVLVGDFNMHRDAHETAYRNYVGEFYDSYRTTSTECIPTTRPAVTGTATNWERADSPSFTSSAFDHIFYDHLVCTHRYYITEDFNRPITPSDHLPVMCTFTFETSATHPTVFTATDETSLLAAIAQATPKDTILLTSGDWVLSQSLSPDKSVCLIGGYNDTFTQVIGKTRLIAPQGVSPVINIPHFWSLSLHNIRIDRASTDNQYGGAAIYSYGSVLECTNCTFLSCEATKNGGAVYASTHDLMLNDCFFKHCNARAGGALYANVYSQCYIDDCRFRANSAQTGGAVHVNTAQSVIVGNTAFWENNSTKTGTLTVDPKQSTFRTISLYNSCFLNNTLQVAKGIPAVTKGFGGSALFTNALKELNTVNIGLCSFIGNNTVFADKSENIFGGAVMIKNYGKTCLINSLFLANALSTTDGVVYDDLEYDDDVKIWRDMDNLYSSTASVGVSPTLTKPLTDMMKGSVDANGFFTADVANGGGYYLQQSTLGTASLQVVTATKRGLEKTFTQDLDHDGERTTVCNTDMRGNTRADVASIGAMEYGGTADAPEPEEKEDGEGWQETVTPDSGKIQSAQKQILNGQLVIIQAQKVYSLLGTCLW